jgi:hypothetical protein
VTKAKQEITKPLLQDQAAGTRTVAEMSNSMASGINHIGEKMLMAGKEEVEGCSMVGPAIRPLKKYSGKPQGRNLVIFLDLDVRHMWPLSGLQYLIGPVGTQNMAQAHMLSFANIIREFKGRTGTTAYVSCSRLRKK